jgi:hypothetical protein
MVWILAFLLALALSLPTTRARADGGNLGENTGKVVRGPQVTPSRSIPGGDSPSAKATTAIPVGTAITLQNWQQYRQYMSEGVQTLFEGRYFWKMPADAEIHVGRTTVNPLPKYYLAATEKYSSQVRLTELPNGGLSFRDYQGGIPFPNPSEPHKGWKILANVWLRYIPHLSVINHAGGCMVDRGGNINCSMGELVYRQLSYNTDPGVPPTVPAMVGKFWTQWFMITEPEQKRYTASLTIAYTDPERSEDVYAFLPALRRYQPVSALARCSTTEGMDITPEDYRAGYDSNLAQMKVEYLGEKKVLALILSKMPGNFPAAYDMPLGWPKPSWGDWQVRDVYVISASKLAPFASGYCYGKRVMYVDKATFNTYWEELYDEKMQPWKIVGFFLHTIDVPGIGPVDSTGSVIYSFWDIQNNHASFITDPADQGPNTYINEQAPRDYLDLTRYSNPAGLNLIMR